MALWHCSAPTKTFENSTEATITYNTKNQTTMSLVAFTVGLPHGCLVVPLWAWHMVVPLWAFTVGLAEAANSGSNTQGKGCDALGAGACCTGQR